MDTEDGQIFVRNLAQFVRTHEKALANALQLRRQDLKSDRNRPKSIGGSASPLQCLPSTNPPSSISSALAAALSLGSLSFASHNVKPAKLTLTSHHLFYLLSRFEEVGITVGPLNIRTENLHAETSPANYVSFLSQALKPHGWSDRDSMHSVTSVRSVMLGMSALWPGLGSANNLARTEKAQAQLILDLKYLYSAFTKIPCLRLAPDRKARLIRGYEEFPFDTAVPLLAFKNLSALEICDVDFRQFFGWDRIAEQLRSLTLKRAHIDDPSELITSIVLDDMDKRRRRSSKVQSSPNLAWPSSPPVRFTEVTKASSTPSPSAAEDSAQTSTSPQNDRLPRARNASSSPKRPTSSKQNTSFRQVKSSNTKIKRSGSGSSESSVQSSPPTVGAYRTGSSSNLLLVGTLPSSKWRFLRHLSLADNALTSISAAGLAPLANSLYSLDLSSNLFAEVPDGLVNLVVLRALNLSNCMIGSLQSLIRNPLPAITSLNLRANRLVSIAGVERLLSLERLDLRENKIGDPTELARLTGLPEFREVWVAQNPFTSMRSYSNYRVTIFNLFRNTRGLINDILIDASAPTYTERKQLVDRVPEGEPVSVLRQTQLETETHPPNSTNDQQNKALQHLTDYQIRGQDIPSLYPSPHYQQPGTTDVYHASSTTIPSATRSRRSKRGVRRQRLVNLAAGEAVIHNSDTSPHSRLVDQESAIPSTRSPTPNTLASNESPSAPLGTQYQAHPDERIVVPRLQAPSISSINGEDGQSGNDSRHTKLRAENYRQRIEAFKQDVGSSWLSALSEDGLGSDKRADIDSPGVSAIRRVKAEMPPPPRS
ncbi:MAG: hypothetical protein LQ348_000647 [Seirophora lacunosa]|nr:MAG: hypothetical protein LQ344_002521 [Seirophora lacunosa]KAI4207224.1 MAG: hypothetical protein LQ348_000647 [Seirophora lacunosa]